MKSNIHIKKLDQVGSNKKKYDSEVLSERDLR
jgi:hypothetical protein